MNRKPHSQETKNKISETLKKKGIKPITAGWNKGIPAWNKGKTKKDYPQFSNSGVKKGNSPWNKGTIGLQAMEKHPNWKGGITPLNVKIRTSREYNLWRIAVFERDGYACILGGKEHGNKLNADHIKPFSTHPELRFAIDNGRTLCVSCHLEVTRKQHKDGLFPNSFKVRLNPVTA